MRSASQPYIVPLVKTATAPKGAQDMGTVGYLPVVDGSCDVCHEDTGEPVVHYGPDIDETTLDLNCHIVCGASLDDMPVCDMCWETRVYCLSIV